MKKTTLLLVCALLFSFGLTKAQTVLLSEDFEGGSLPSGWTQTTNATDGGWKFGTNTVLQSSNFPISAHTKMACSNDDACNCDKSADYLITPALDFSSSTYVFMSFASYFFNLSYNGAVEEATIEASTDGGSNWTVVNTVPADLSSWETKSVDLSAYAGQSNVLIAFHYNDGGDWLYGWALDDVSIYEPVEGVDAAVSTLVVGKYDPTPTFVGFPTYLSGLDLTPRATITNSATETITSFDISWTDGTNTYNESVSGVNIPPLSTYDFTASDPYTTLAGSHTITFTLSNINNGATEISTDNNAFSYDVEGVTANPDRKYLAEEGTGTWCGWCPRGTVFMDYMRESYPDQFVGIAVHNGDPMTNSDYDSQLGVTAFPTVVTNRKTSIDPSQIEGDFISKITSAPVVTLDASAKIDQTTNDLTVTVTGNFLQNLSGDYRFAAVVVEDSVHGTTSQYKQSNYYANNAAGPMAGWENLPSSVPAAQMYYEQVGRDLLGTFDGVSGSIPSTVTAGDSYSYSFDYQIPSTININHMWVVVMVIKHSTGEVMNVNKTGWEFSTGINNVHETASLFIYPNPASDVAYLDLKLETPSDVTIQVLNSIGQIVATNSYSSLSNDQVIPLNIQNFTQGIYNVVAKVGDRTYIKKLVVGQ